MACGGNTVIYVAYSFASWQLTVDFSLAFVIQSLTPDQHVYTIIKCNALHVIQYNGMKWFKQHPEST